MKQLNEDPEIEGAHLLPLLKRFWDKAEKDKFMAGLELYGTDWLLISEHVGTKSWKQVRSHANNLCDRFKDNPFHEDAYLLRVL